MGMGGGGVYIYKYQFEERIRFQESIPADIVCNLDH